MPKQEQTRLTNGHTEKLCPHCKEWKDKETEFSKKGVRLHKTRSWCKACCVSDVAQWRERKRSRWQSPLTGRIQYIVAHMVHCGSPLRSADIRELYEHQEGLCYYTGLKMKVMSDIKRDPLLMSLDRIDSSKEHEKGNVVLCCLGVNNLKGSHSQETFYSTLKVLYEAARDMGRV